MSDVDDDAAGAARPERPARNTNTAREQTAPASVSATRDGPSVPAGVSATRDEPAVPSGVSAARETLTTAAASTNLQHLYARRLAEHGFQSDPAQLAAVVKLDDLRQRLMRAHTSSSSVLRRWLGRLNGGSPREPERGLYLWGGVGRGKTWLMDMFFQSLPFREARRRHFHRFMHEVHVQLKHLQNREAPLEVLAAEIARDTRVLCFDELFVTDIADAMILGGLFAGLFKRGVTLVATSNAPPRDLYKNGLQRQRFLPAIDLIEQHVEVVNVDGAIDYRLRQLTQAGTYLLSSSPNTPQRLEALFTELADHDATSGGTIDIEGRAIPVVRRSNSAVWFNFFAICDGPRSQDDYIEIAREYQTVVIAGVPIFDSLRESEARRFIAVVDELYDHNVNLIVSAAKPPNELYRGERLSFEFERTVSRLIEMQSADYLAREHKP